MRIFFLPLAALLILVLYGIPVLASQHTLTAHAVRESPVLHETSYEDDTGTGALAAAAALPPIAPPSFFDSTAFAYLGNRLSASGMLILDLQSGQVLAEKGGKHTVPMASLTKLMTALIIGENHSLDEMVTISQNAVDSGGSTAYLPLGESFSVADLLTALLVASANDAAIALAEYHSGDEAAFVQEMNERAESLGLRNTSFTNATGFDHPRQFSTPQNIGWLALSVLRVPALRERLSREKATITGKQGTVINLETTHLLLRQDSPVIAGKTGTTPKAKECLLSLIARDAKEYIVVLLKSDSRYADMRTILDTFPTPIEPVFSSI